MEEYSIVSLLNISQNEEQEGENHEKLDEFICAHGEMLSDEEGSPNHTPLSTPTKSEANAHHQYSPSSPLSCGPTCHPQDAYPVSLPSEHSAVSRSEVYVQPRQLNLSMSGGERERERVPMHKAPRVPSDGEVAELQHLRVLCGAQGGRIEQLIGQLAAREEESERQIRVIRHEKTVAMEELDKMAKLYRELEASREVLSRDMASLRGQLEEEKTRVQELDVSRGELISQLQSSEAAKECLMAQVKELSSSDILSRVRDGYASAQTQSKELHDHQIATLKGEIDAIRCASDAKTETIQQLQSEIRELHTRLSEGSHGPPTSPKSLHLDGEEEDLQTRLVQLSAHTEDMQYQLTASLEQLEGAEHRAACAQEALQVQSSELNAVKEDRQYLRDQLNLFQQQLAQLKQDADLDKKACLDKCRQTLLQLHEEATNRIRQSQLADLQRAEGEHQKQVSRLQGELSAVKEEYTQLCREKTQLASELEQVKTKQLGMVEPARDETLVRAKVEWREQMMKENAAMLERALQESQRSWQHRLEREKAQAVYEVRQEWERKVEDARRELEGLRQNAQQEKEQAKNEAVRLARAQWVKDGDQTLQARTDSAVNVAHKLWREQEVKARAEAIEAAVSSVRRECDQQMKKAVLETAERVKQECRRERTAEVEAAVAGERARVVKEREATGGEEAKGKRELRTPAMTLQKQPGEEGSVKRLIQQARVQWEAEQSMATKTVVDEATQAVRDHYESLLRECEDRWRQQVAKGMKGLGTHLLPLKTELVMNTLGAKIQEQIESTRQSLKKDIALLLAEKDAMHQAELAQTRLSITREVEGVYLRYLEKMTDHDASGREVPATTAPDDVIKKTTPAKELKKPPKRVMGDKQQPTRQPHKIVK